MIVLLTDEQRAQLLANGRRVRADEAFEPRPVVRLVLPGTGMVWLLSEIDPDRQDHLFGIFDRGFGALEMCYLSERVLAAVHGPDDRSIERDAGFRTVKTMGAYVSEALQASRPVAQVARAKGAVVRPVSGSCA